MLSQVRLKWTHPWVCLAFLRFLRMQKALLYWMMMQSCLTADHLGMKCGFSPSIFKYWKLCFQQGWPTKAFTEHYFMRCYWMTPSLKVQSGASCGNGLWHVRSIFWGSCSAISLDIWVLVWTVVAALTAGWIFPSAGGSDCLLSPCHSRAAATQNTKPGYMLSVGRLIL